MTVVDLSSRRRIDPTLKVSEIFGPTLQGEGPSAGRACNFVRLGLCNLDCGWCDTPFTWDWKGKNGVAYDRKAELSTMPVADIIAEVEELATRPMLTVISGGEPLVQAASLDRLVSGLLDSEAVTSVEIETNGTHLPSELLQSLSINGYVHFNVSPKLSGSGVDPRTAIVPETLKAFGSLDSIYKFVVSNQKELAEIKMLSEMIGVPGDRIWLMPEGTSSDVIASNFAAVFDAAVLHGWSCSTRLHVLAHEDKRRI